MSDPSPIVVASHQRSGTHLLMDLCRRQFAECDAKLGPAGNPHEKLYLSIDRFNAKTHNPTTPERAERMLNSTPRPLIKTHNYPDLRETAEQHRDFVHGHYDNAAKFYCVRDGRDVLCSLQRFRQRFDPNASATIGDFLRETEQGQSRVALWADHVRAWINHPGVHVIRFEDVTKKTADVLRAVESQTGMAARNTQPLLPPRAKSRAEIWIARLFGKVNSTNVVGRPGGAAPVKWKQSFTPDDRAFFHEQAGDLLIELGYAADDSWIGNSTGDPTSNSIGDSA